jgi:poly-gamma-glutamate capsule biosynthesis protein CapA/YwtB (metallophosphatase superfamily)
MDRQIKHPFRKHLSDETVRLVLCGDLMLGRLVNKAILKYGPGYPLGKVSEALKKADLTLINLESAITSSTSKWPGEPKAFYFGAAPEAIESLLQAGIDGVSLANNHTLDFGTAGLLETIDLLKRNKIEYAGAGANLKEAREPMIFKRHGIQFGMVADCDHQEDFAAGEDHPGIAYLNLEDEEKAIEQIREDLLEMQSAGVDWPILSLHWGPNMVWRPSPYFKEFAHSVIDSGFKILYGHSAHVFHGVEIYKQCPIFYSAGDFVDDYYVDSDFKNDHQIFFELEIKGGNLDRIILHPVFIHECRTVPADREQTEYVVKQMRLLCKELGTKIEQKEENAWIPAR